MPYMRFCRKAHILLPGIGAERALEKRHGPSGQPRVTPSELDLPSPGNSGEVAGHLRAERVVGAQPSDKEEGESM